LGLEICKVCGKRIVDHTREEQKKCIEAVWKRMGVEMHEKD